MYHYCDKVYPSEKLFINRARVDYAGYYVATRRRIYSELFERFNYADLKISCQKSGYSIHLQSKIARRFQEPIISGKTLFPLSKK